MKLLTKAILTAFAKQGSTADKSAKDIKIICKLFGGAACTWWLYEQDKEDPDLFMCFATLGDPSCAECGTVSLKELQSIRFPPLGLVVERNLYYEIGEQTLQDVIDANNKLK